MFPSKPAYAMISLGGGHATVVFHRVENSDGSGSSGSHSGWDQSVLPQYTGCGVPLIDLRTVEQYQSPTVYCRETTIPFKSDPPSKYVGVEEYVEIYRQMGATISTL